LRAGLDAPRQHFEERRPYFAARDVSVIAVFADTPRTQFIRFVQVGRKYLISW
jgi:hypothetical protein